MISFHSCKAMHVEQEVYARLLLYNITEALVQPKVLETVDTTHEYQVNFTRAAHICSAFLRSPSEEGRMDLATLLRKELISIRKGKKIQDCRPPTSESRNTSSTERRSHRAAVNSIELF